MSERAKRYNRGKRRYELAPSGPFGHLVDVYTRGAHKYSVYKDKEGNLIKGQDIQFEELPELVAQGSLELVEDGANNWRKGASWMETIAAHDRHVSAWKNLEEIDSDLGTFHLANAAWGLFSLMEFAKTHPELDDRPRAFFQKKKIGLDIDGVLADFIGHLKKVCELGDHKVHYWNDPLILKAFEKVKKDPNFWSEIPPLIPGNSLLFEPHCYITARSIDPEITERWLDFHGFPKAIVLRSFYRIK
jgi:hypothetical protein